MDLSYARALHLVDRTLWRKSLVFRIDAPYSEQRSRNEHRPAATPQAVMDTLYRHDDPESLTAAGIPVTNLADGTPQQNAATIADAIYRQVHNI